MYYAPNDSLIGPYVIYAIIGVSVLMAICFSAWLTFCLCCKKNKKNCKKFQSMTVDPKRPQSVVSQAPLNET